MKKHYEYRTDQRRDSEAKSVRQNWICRWIDEEVADDLIFRIGISRSIELRQQIEQMCKVASPKRRVHIGNTERDSVGYAAQPAPDC
jgi:hypothetical protein